MVNSEHIAKLVRIIIENGNEDITPYYGYSGRGMYGDRCFGFSVSQDVNERELYTLLLETAMENCDEDTDFLAYYYNFLADYVEDIVALMRMARSDSLGQRTIIYFPGFDLGREEVGDVEENEDEE